MPQMCIPLLIRSLEGVKSIDNINIDSFQLLHEIQLPGKPTYQTEALSKSELSCLLGKKSEESRSEASKTLPSVGLYSEPHPSAKCR